MGQSEGQEEARVRLNIHLSREYHKIMGENGQVGYRPLAWGSHGCWGLVSSYAPEQVHTPADTFLKYEDPIFARHLAFVAVLLSCFWAVL